MISGDKVITLGAKRPRNRGSFSDMEKRLLLLLLLLHMVQAGSETHPASRKMCKIDFFFRGKENGA
jgi:hypothetical protein